MDGIFGALGKVKRWERNLLQPEPINGTIDPMNKEGSL